MAVTTNTATIRKTNTGVVTGNGIANKVTSHVATVEIAASSSSSTIDFGNFPSNARIAGCSRIYWDDLATSGSPTLDLGTFAVNGNVTSNDDSLNDGLALSSVSTANVGSVVIKDIANFGKPLWEIAGASSDPGGVIKIKGTLRDAATTATGTVTLDLLYAVD